MRRKMTANGTQDSQRYYYHTRLQEKMSDFGQWIDVSGRARRRYSSSSSSTSFLDFLVFLGALELLAGFAALVARYEQIA